MQTYITLACALTLLLSLPTRAQTPNPDITYYGLEPEIVTNYISSNRYFGYIRVQAEMMLDNAELLEDIEHHEPLIRATLVEIFGRQEAQRIKTLEGREAIRQECLEEINTILSQEIGQSPLINLLFTRYLYN